MRWALLLPLALAALSGTALPAFAHRLDAQCFVRPSWQVQVESWYETGEAPRGARVEVFRTDGQLLTTGKLDRNGVFVFSYKELQALKVVVTSVGHRAEAPVTAEALERAAVCTCVASLPPTPPFLAAALLSSPETSGSAHNEPIQLAEPIADHRSSVRWGNALLGVGGLLAVAALFRWLSLRQRLSARSNSQEPDRFTRSS